MQTQPDVIIPIRPKYVAKIRSGEKTIELRKSFPTACKPPFKVYIYETLGGQHNVKERGCGAVVGEFTCTGATVMNNFMHKYFIDGLTVGQEELDKICIDYDTLMFYGREMQLFLWHIENPIFYEKPVPLFRFYSSLHHPGMILRAPQSWIYCDRLSEGEVAE